MSLILATLLATAAATSPIPGFRPPAVPILAQSPLINVFSPFDTLNEGDVTHWTGNNADWFSGIRVDGAFYLLLGNPAPSWSAAPLQRAAQVGVAVFATQTVYSFTAGPVALNLTFTSPQIPTDFDLMSRPSHYVTADVAATDGATHAVQLYFDVTPRLVIEDAGADVAFGTVAVAPGAEALAMGNAAQQPLSSTNDRANWGVMYLTRDTTVPSAGALQMSNVSRSAWVATGALPPGAGPVSPIPFSGGKGPATGVQKGVDRPGYDLPGSPFSLARADPSLCWGHCNVTGGCKSWAYADPTCDSQFTKPTCWLKGDYAPTVARDCRWSGAQAGYPTGGGVTIAAAATYDFSAAAAPVRRVFTVSVDEVLGISWFGELMPPWWRRALPVNSTAAVPTAMLADSVASYDTVKILCDTWDADTAAMLSAAGGDEYATIAQLTYRQVFAGQMLVFSPVRNTVWCA